MEIALLIISAITLMICSISAFVSLCIIIKNIIKNKKNSVIKELENKKKTLISLLNRTTDEYSKLKIQEELNKIDSDLKSK